MTVHPGRSALALLLAVVSASGSALAGPLELRNAWMRPAPAGTDTRAYVDIVSEDAFELTGASTPLAQRVEIVVVASDREPASESVVATLAVPKGTTRLAYRGSHLRLTGIRWDAGNGQLIPLTLHLRDATGAEVFASTDLLVRGILTPRQVPAAERTAIEPASAAREREPPATANDSPPQAGMPPSAPSPQIQPRM